MSDTVEKRITALEVTLGELSKNTMKLANAQEANDRSINRLLIQFQDHFAVEEQHEEQLKEYRDKHEQTLHELTSSVKQLSIQLASMPGLHDKSMRETLNPIYNRCRMIEDKAAIAELSFNTAINKSEEKTKKELVIIGKIYAYIASFLVSIILVVCGYLYVDLKEASDLNTRHILENIRSTHS